MALGATTQTGVTAQGGALVAEVVQRVLVQPLAAASVFLASGVQIIDSASPVRLPIAPDPSNALGFTAEGQSIPEVTPSFDALHLLPSTMESVKVISRFTSELARQSVVAIDAALQANLVTSVAATLDTQFIAGNGDGVTTPRGLLNYPGAQSLAVGGALSVDNVYDAISLAETAYLDDSELRFWVHPQTMNGLRKLKATGTGNYLLQPNPTQATPYTLAGIPVTVTSRLPVVGTTTKTTTAVLWAPGRSTVVRDLSPSVRILTERYADTDEIGVQVIARYDWGCAKPQSIVKLTGISAS